MARRLLDWPAGIIPKEIDVLDGPQVISGGDKKTLTGGIQVVQSPNSLWKFQFVFDKMWGKKARTYSGLITALHGGANAVVIPWVGGVIDPTLDELGIIATTAQISAGVAWNNNMPWSNDLGWNVSPGHVSLSQAAAMGDTVIYLADEGWRNNLDFGSMIGFAPFHFGWYKVTKVIGGGAFQIWPPLGSALTTDHRATLKPSIVMTLEKPGAANLGIRVGYSEESTITLVQVSDANVRTYYDR